MVSGVRLPWPMRVATPRLALAQIATGLRAAVTAALEALDVCIANRDAAEACYERARYNFFDSPDQKVVDALGVAFETQQERVAFARRKVDAARQVRLLEAVP